jgi:hypothetical protein
MTDDVPETLQQFTRNPDGFEVPLWRIEDKLTEARKKAQAGNRDACLEATREALDMLE